MVKEESEKSCDKCKNWYFCYIFFRKCSTVDLEEFESEGSNFSFWSSYPIENLTPEQRKHYKEIMRKEVKKARS